MFLNTNEESMLIKKKARFEYKQGFIYDILTDK